MTVRGLLLLLFIGCRPGINYDDPVSPRYAGRARFLATPPEHDTLRIVSFNIEYARQMRKAAGVLATAPALRGADVILLQEMTAPATRFIADSLHMRFVYYPAIYNRIRSRLLHSLWNPGRPWMERACRAAPADSR